MAAEGIDVSNNNGGNLPDSGVEFLIAKASEGTSFDDEFFEGYRSEAVSRGIPWGPYHFPHPDVNTPAQEAAWFLKNAQRGPLGWALDVEKRTDKHGNEFDPLAIMGADNLAAWCEEFRQIVEPELGRSWFYTFRDYATHLYPRLDTKWGTWLATLDGEPHAPTFAGRTVDIEQYAVVDKILRDLARTPLVPDSEPGDDMIPPVIFQLENAKGDLVVIPSGGGRPWTAKASDAGLVGVFAFRVLHPDPTHRYPFPNPIPVVSDAAQVASIRSWLATTDQ